ncbi:MAG: hypothetical protein K0R51_641 [Cytophagaceae bacterium]|jgi:hypothetical protein|nr:hypothetical protein [Cytophagaceae bacterium]
MKNTLLLLCLYSVVSFAQAQSKIAQVYIAPFRHDAEGAYTLIHDDFGAQYARGIEEYIDTMTYNRKLPICFAAITGECDQEDWTKAKAMIAHGHQILNHTMSHKCGQPQNWCTFGNWDEKDFPTEIDKSTELIWKNTGKHPAFFIFPFDLSTDTMVNYLRAKHYLGARAGKVNMLNDKKLNDPFLLNYTVFRPGEPHTALNEFADKAIQSKSWAIRVMHGIEDESWAHITAEEYATHLNHLQRQIQNHKLWMATLSDVVTYQYIKETSDVAITDENKKGQATQITLEPLNAKLPDEKLLTNHSLTIVLTQTGSTPKSITQETQAVPFEVRDGKIIMEVNTLLHEIVLTY